MQIEDHFKFKAPTRIWLFYVLISIDKMHQKTNVANIHRNSANPGVKIRLKIAFVYRSEAFGMKKKLNLPRNEKKQGTNSQKLCQHAALEGL